MSLEYLIFSSILINIIINIRFIYTKANNNYTLDSSEDNDTSPLENYDLSKTYVNRTYIRGKVDNPYKIKIEFRAKDNLRWNYEINLNRFKISNSYNLKSDNLNINKTRGEKLGQIILSVAQNIPCTTEDNILSFTYNNEEIPVKVALNMRYTYKNFIYQGENKIFCDVSKDPTFTDSYYFAAYFRNNQIYLDITLSNEEYDNDIKLYNCNMEDFRNSFLKCEKFRNFENLPIIGKNENFDNTTFHAHFKIEEIYQYFILLITLEKGSAINCVNINFYTKNESESTGKIDDNDGTNYTLIFGIIIPIVILFAIFIYVYWKIKKIKGKNEPEEEIYELNTKGNEVLVNKGENPNQKVQKTKD